MSIASRSKNICKIKIRKRHHYARREWSTSFPATVGTVPNGWDRPGLRINDVSQQNGRWVVSTCGRQAHRVGMVVLRRLFIQIVPRLAMKKVCSKTGWFSWTHLTLEKKKDFWLAGTLDAMRPFLCLKHRWCKQSFSVCTLVHTGGTRRILWILPWLPNTYYVRFSKTGNPGLDRPDEPLRVSWTCMDFWGGRGGRTIFDVNIHFHNEKFPIFIFAWRLVWHFLLVLSLSYQRKHVFGDIFGQDLLYIKGFNPQPKRNLANTSVSVPSAPFPIVRVCIKQMVKHQTMALFWDVLRGGFGVIEIHKPSIS